MTDLYVARDKRTGDARGDYISAHSDSEKFIADFFLYSPPPPPPPLLHAIEQSTSSGGGGDSGQ